MALTMYQRDRHHAGAWRATHDGAIDADERAGDMAQIDYDDEPMTSSDMRAVYVFGAVWPLAAIVGLALMAVYWSEITAFVLAIHRWLA